MPILLSPCIGNRYKLQLGRPERLGRLFLFSQTRFLERVTNFWYIAAENGALDQPALLGFPLFGALTYAQKDLLYWA